MPKQRPGRSRQDYETPWGFIHAVEGLIKSKFSVDLAATPQNSRAENICKDSLNQNWNHFHGWLWLNPPFSHIEPWAEKCWNSEAKICFLVPASIGSNWFAKYVYGRALVLALNPRISFDGIGPYPKDCILAIYGKKPGFDIWRWK